MMILIGFVFTQVEKVLLIPEHTMIGQSGPELFENENSKFNKHYMKESDNVALFWEKIIWYQSTKMQSGSSIRMIC